MNTKKLIHIGVFSAIAFVLQLLVPFKVGGFLDIEFSDIPAILLSFAEGPLAGVLVELVKNILHLSLSGTGFVGEFANFTINGIFVFVLGVIYKSKKTKKNAVFSLAAATVVLAAAAFVINYYIMLPLYMPQIAYSDKLKICLYTITPFNLGKGAVLSVITMMIYKKISRLLK